MKTIKLFEEFNRSDIKELCTRYGIKNYTINSDGLVDVDGNVYLDERRLTNLPIKFNNVNGNFYCCSNKLKSLDGCPTEVSGSFYCQRNELETLEGCPNIVGDDFYCYDNPMISLEHCPTIVGGNFYCYGNNLKTLNGFSTKVGGDFNCSSNRVYEVWKLINDKEYLEIFIDYDMFRDGNVIILDILNDLLELIGKPKVKKVDGYTCI